jgi:hypothetical protein
MGEKWLGGDMNYPGGGFKVNLLKKALSEYKDEKDLVIMFTDSYDVIIAGGKGISLFHHSSDTSIYLRH